MANPTRRAAAATIFAALAALLTLPGALAAQSADRTVSDVPSIEVTRESHSQSELRFAGSVGGTLGSTAGLIGGALLGYAMASCSSGEWFCGMGESALGGAAGSILGSAVGARIGIRLAGGEPADPSALEVLLGVAAGIGATVLVAEVADDDSLAPLLSFSLAQGVVTGLLAAR